MEMMLASTEMASRLDVMTVGDICVDLIVTGNVRPQFHQVEQIVGDCSLELGGSATIFASQLGKLGAQVGVIGWVGRDAFGEFVVNHLEMASVDTALIREHASLRTGIGIALSEKNDRAILTYMGTINATCPEDLHEDMLNDCRHWHTASYFLLTKMQGYWREWFNKCRSHGVTVSLDTNWDPQNKWEGVLDVLPYVDIFLPNEAEALAISQENSVTAAAKKLASLGPMVVIKLGERGALAIKDDQCWNLHPNEVTGIPESIVDSTGAGDNFNAGFLHCYLAGQDIYSCLQSGHRCAIASLSQPGGVRGQLWDSPFAACALANAQRTYDKVIRGHQKRA